MPPAFSVKKRRAFKLAAVALVILFFVIIELLLRAVGYGTDYPLFIEVKNHPEQLMMNPKVGEKYFFFTGNATSGYQEAFAKEKAADTYRIFLLGASTGIGYPYRYNGSPHRWLQFALNTTFPDKDIEVINLSLTAINSYTLLDFTDQVIDQHPNAVLIYAGHNEYYGALGVGASNALSDSPGFVNFMLAARKYRLVQAVAQGAAKLKKAFFSTPTTRESLMQKMVADQYIPLGSDKFKAGIDQFDHNLHKMLNKFDTHNVPTLISTLVSNEQGLKPFVSDTTSLELNARHHFELGKKALKNGDFSRAKAEFVRAKELDELRFRAPLKMNEIIENDAAQHKKVFLVDTRKRFEEASSNGILGNDLLLEHVHPNLKGYSLLAHNFYMGLKEHGQTSKKWPKPLSWQNLMDQMPITEVDSIAGAYELLMLKEGWPFFEPIDKSKLKTETTPQRIAGKLAIRKYSWEEAMQKLYTFYYQNHRYDKALQVIEGLVLEHPKQGSLLFKAGTLALQMDSIAKADRLYNKLFKIDPSSANAKKIARRLIDAGALRESLPYLEKIMETDRRDVQAIRYFSAIKGILNIKGNEKELPKDNQNLLKLARFYLMLGQRNESEPLIHQVLAKDPDNTEGLKLLAEAKKM